MKQFTESQLRYARLAWGRQYVYSASEYERTRKKYAFLYGDLLPPGKDANILDVGCAGGRFLSFLQGRGYTNFYGIDLDDEAVAQCHINITNQASVEDVFSYLRDRADSYDLIVCNHVIEHFSREGSMALLEAFHRSLKSRGRVIIATPNAANYWVGYHFFSDLTHDHLYTAKSLENSLRLAGFAQVSIREETPVPYNALHAIRYLLWKVRRLYLSAMFAIEVSAGFYEPMTMCFARGIIGVADKE